MLVWLLGLRAADASPIHKSLAAHKHYLTGVLVISAVVNILALTGSIFMIQVYDRVLASQSLTTLAALAAIAMLAYFAQGWLELVRQRVLALIGERVEGDVGPIVQRLSLLLQVRSLPPDPHGGKGKSDQDIKGGETNQFVRDVEAVRACIAGQAPVAALDLPWLPLYLAILFYIEIGLGLLATGAAIVLLLLTWATEHYGRAPSKALSEAIARRNMEGEAASRAGESVIAMGMSGTVAQRWKVAHEDALKKQRNLHFLVSGFQVSARTFRFVLQSALIALGAYYAIRGKISAGAIVACSILATRALAPVDLIIGGLKSTLLAREGVERLLRLFRLESQLKTPDQELPLPKERLQVDGLVVGPPAPPHLMRATVRNLTFALNKGSAVIVRGESGSGKSSLARALVGIWEPLQGRVRLDGSDLNQWNQDHLGRAIGYLPQDVQLQPGTLTEVISRFDPNAKMDDVIAAAKAAGVDDMIRGMRREGYEMRIGPGGEHLSQGQRQRVGLARALYGNPFLIVLDEPNSNLDPVGDAALSRAIRNARERGAIVVVISHRDVVIRDVDHVLELAGGTLQFFDKREVWIEQMKQAQSKQSGDKSKTSGAGAHGAIGGQIGAGASGLRPAGAMAPTAAPGARAPALLTADAGPSAPGRPVGPPVRSGPGGPANAGVGSAPPMHFSAYSASEPVRGSVGSSVVPMRREAGDKASPSGSAAPRGPNTTTTNTSEDT